MNSYSLFGVLFLSLIFSERVNYWNLGVSINKDSKIVVQREVDLNNIKTQSTELYAQNKNQLESTIYTLQTNTFIQPTSIFVNEETESDNFSNNIKELILNEEYFNAAKQIMSLDSSSTLEEFSSLNEFHYWASFVFYNLGNYAEARNNITLINNRENNPEIVFLEALISQATGDDRRAKSLFQFVINEFPQNDYANYAKNILKEE